MSMLPIHHSLLLRGWLALLAVFGAGLAPAQVLPPGCAASSPGPCAYAPQRVYNAADIGVTDLTLYDASRRNHPVPVRVRYPKPATDALPVVILSHGGSTADEDGAYSMNTSAERGNSFAMAGYVVIHVVRLMVEPQSLTDAQLNDCINAGTIAGSLLTGANIEEARRACRVFLGWHVYGPQNVAFVADVIKGYRRGMLPEYAGLMDASRIAVGGWSGGTEASLNIAGAFQSWSSRLNRLRGGAATAFTFAPVVVPGAVAFMADSPRAPAWAGQGSGFQSESFWGIDERPFLFTSGRYDTGADVGPNAARATSWVSARPGNKFLAWTLSDQAIHSTMNIGEEGCTPTTDPARRAMCTALMHLSVAFLDAAVKRHPPAIDWLASDAFQALSGQQFELHRR